MRKIFKTNYTMEQYTKWQISKAFMNLYKAFFLILNLKGSMGLIDSGKYSKDFWGKTSNNFQKQENIRFHQDYSRIKTSFNVLNVLLKNLVATTQKCWYCKPTKTIEMLHYIYFIPCKLSLQQSFHNFPSSNYSINHQIKAANDRTYLKKKKKYLKN